MSDPILTNKITQINENIRIASYEIIETTQRLTNTIQAIAVWQAAHTSCASEAEAQLRAEFSRINSSHGVREVSNSISSISANARG